MSEAYRVAKLSHLGDMETQWKPERVTPCAYVFEGEKVAARRGDVAEWATRRRRGVAVRVGLGATKGCVMTIDLDPCEPGTKCAGCPSTADGLRRNLDRNPTCRACEAARLAMIELILEAAEVAPVGEQLGLL